MGETIALKESGAVLRKVDPDLYDIGNGLIRFRAHAKPRGSCIFIDDSDPRRFKGDASALEWLDGWIVSTRAALTPPGHVLVGPEARERIARALIDVHRRQFDLTTDPPPAALEKSLDYADAVLRALGVRGGA